MKMLESLEQLEECKDAQFLLGLLHQTAMNPDFRTITLQTILSDIQVFREAKSELLLTVPAIKASTDFMQHLATVERLMERRGGSLEIASPEVVVDYNLLAQEIDVLRQSLTDDMRDLDRLQQANFLSYFDFQMAAVNAYCPENFAFASGPKITRLGGQTAPMVSARDNPVLFTHIVNSVQIEKDVQTAKMVKQQGIVSISEQYYKEYIDLMQHASRIFEEKPDTYRQRAVLLVSKLLVYEQAKMGGALQTLDTMLQIGKRKNNLLSVTSSLNRTFDIACPSGSTVYMPGAGFNAVKALPFLKKEKDVRFVLNDKNPFVTGVLSEITSLTGADNIRVHQGSLESAELSPDTVSVMILSLLHNVPKENMQLLAEQAKDFMRSDGRIILFHSEPRQEEHPQSHEVTELFESQGFHTKSVEKMSYEKMSAFPNLQNNLQQTSDEILRLAQRNAAAERSAHGTIALLAKS